MNALLARSGTGATVGPVSDMPREPISQNLIIAEHDFTMRNILRSALEHPRRAVYLAADGGEAVNYAEHMQADLILLDMRMPRLDGLEACARIRGMPRYRDTPIVILTAFDGDNARRKAKRAGATAFFVKPFTINGLLRGIAPLMSAGHEAGR